MLHLQLWSKKRHLFYVFGPKRSRCVTLLGCGHLEDSEFEKCTVFFYTKLPYKSAEAPRSQTGVPREL